MTCPIQRIMLEVRNAIASVLDHYSLEDFGFPNPGGKLPSMKSKPVSRATRRKSSDIQS